MLPKKIFISLLLSIILIVAFKYNFKSTVAHRGLYHGYDLLLLFSFLMICFLLLYGVVEKFYHLCKSERNYNLLFLVIIGVILLFPLTKISDKQTDVVENRKLHAYPSLHVNGGVNYNYGKEFEAWLNDHFRKREMVIAKYNEFDSWINGRVENARAVKGEDDWLFYKGDDSLANYRNANNFTEQQLVNLKERLEAKRDFCKSIGAEYYVFIAPDKNQIYGEYYPDYYKLPKENSISRGEQLFLFLKKNSDLKVVYPKEILRSSKPKQVLYYKDDTHWNDIGALLGYEQLMLKIKEDYHDVPILSINDFNIMEKPHNGDLKNMLMIKDKTYLSPTLEFKEKPRYESKAKKQSNPSVDSGRKHIVSHNPEQKYHVILFRDSFTSAMMPYISSSFGNAEYLWTRAFEKNKKYILLQKPDIVIEEAVERYVQALIN